MVENMSHFTCPHCQQVIDIFSRGGAERTAQQFELEFLGSVELDPEIRSGGDRGLPVTLAGDLSEQAAPFYKIARQVAERAQEHASKEKHFGNSLDRSGKLSRVRQSLMILPFVRELFADLDNAPAFTRVRPPLVSGVGRRRVWADGDSALTLSAAAGAHLQSPGLRGGCR